MVLMSRQGILSVAVCLLVMGGCFSADPRGVIRGVKNLEPQVEERGRQIDELANPGSQQTLVESP
jgi:hypothetical protein